MSTCDNCSEHTYKIIVIGDTSVGKSSFIQRFVCDKFVDGYKPTIGVDFMTRTIHFEEETKVKILLFDIAGQERYGGMTRVYYKDAVGCLLLFDLSNYKTFESIEKWKNDLDSKVRMPDNSPIPCVLVGNKSDLPRDSRLTNIDLNGLVSRCNFTAYCRASTKLNQNVNESLNLLIADIMRFKIAEKLTSSQDKSKDEIEKSIKIDEKAKPKLRCVNC